MERLRRASREESSRYHGLTRAVAAARRTVGIELAGGLTRHWLCSGTNWKLNAGHGMGSKVTLVIECKAECRAAGEKRELAHPPASVLARCPPAFGMSHQSEND